MSEKQFRILMNVFLTSASTAGGSVLYLAYRNDIPCSGTVLLSFFCGMFLIGTYAGWNMR